MKVPPSSSDACGRIVSSRTSGGIRVLFEGIPSREPSTDGATVCLGIHSTPFGAFCLAAAGRTVYGAGFVGSQGVAPIAGRLTRAWPRISLMEESGTTAALVAEIQGMVPPSPEPIRVRARGTPFQLEVWRTLLEIPSGEVWTYGRLARAVGQPRGARAVGNAVGANPIAWLVPCHRVVGAGARPGGYHWGLRYKRALLRFEGWEAAWL